MDVKFTKQRVSCLKTALNQMGTQELTQDVRIPDTMPEIGRVVACRGQAMIRGKEWRGSGMTISGGVMVWVLYVPEDGSAPCSVETWIPFQMKWEFPENLPDGEICAEPAITAMDGRSVSARKLMVRVNISVKAAALVKQDMEIPVAEEWEEDIELLKRTYPLDLAEEAGEKMVNIDETLTLPGSAGGIEKIISYHLIPEITEQKIMANRLVFRGKTKYHLLYTDDAGEVRCWDAEVPFSQYADLEQDCSEHGFACLTPIITAAETDITEDMHLLLKASLAVQYTVYDRVMTEIVEDAYSPHREVTLQMAGLQLPALLENTVEEITAEVSLEQQAQKIVDVISYPDHMHSDRSEDKCTGELTGYYQILYTDEEGTLQGTALRYSGNMEIPSAKENSVFMTVTDCGLPQVSMGGNGLTVQQSCHVRIQTVSGKEIQAAEEISFGERKTPDSGRPSLILCRPGENSLWSLAKKCGSTVAAIEKANNLTEEPAGEKLLIVPVL